MKIIAEGKEAVITHLEQEALKTAREPGNYLLGEDDDGNLVAIIAGRSFIGSGTYMWDGNRMTVMNGLVVQILKRKES
jgi:hypothetical protein